MGILHKKLKVSINPKLINKNQANDISLFTHGWENVEVTPEELAEKIDLGVAYCAQLSGPRNKKNFICSDVASVDIDGSRTIEDALGDPLVSKCGTILYKTPRHTSECHRFRLVFALPHTVDRGEDLSAIARALALRLNGDPVAVDPARIYYGSSGSKPSIFDRAIDEELLTDLIAQGKTLARPDTSSSSRGDASVTARLTISQDQELITSDGMAARLSDLAAKQRVCCPFHHDTHPSAFVVPNQRGKLGVHCMVCRSTFWPEDHQSSNFDFFDFERAIKQTYEANNAAKKDPSFKYPPHFDQSLAHARIEIANDRFFELKGLRAGITFVKSPKGSGKTSTLPSVMGPHLWTRPVSRLDFSSDELTFTVPEPALSDKFRVLLIGHRQALIRDLCKRLDLNCYLDDAGLSSAAIGDRQKHYGICLDSLTKFKTHLGFPDLVIIDEVEQVLAHFLSDTLEAARDRIFKYFCKILEKARHIVVLDADLSWNSFHTITQIAGARNATSPQSKPVWIHLNEERADRGTIEVFQSQNHLIGDMKTAIAERKRIFITSNSKAQIDALDAVIADTSGDTIKRIKVTADNSNSPDVQDFIANIKTRSLEYQVILSSPSLGTGIDITFEGGEQHIDIVYGFFENLVNTHFDIDQQISRVRNPKKFKVWISPRRFSFETNVEVVRHDLLVSNLVANTFLGLDDSGREVYRSDDLFLDMASIIVSRHRASKNSLRKNFIELKQAQGWQASFVSSEGAMAKVGHALLTQGRELRDEALIESLMAAKPVDFRKFVSIQDKFESNESVNDEERRSFMRCAIEVFYREPVSAPIIKLDHRGRFRTCVRMFEKITDKEGIKTRQLRLRMKYLDINGRQVKIVHDKDFAPALVYELLSKSPVFRDGQFDFDVSFSTEDLDAFVKEVKEKKPVIETQLDIEVRADIDSKPISQLSAILALTGMKVKPLRTQKSKQKKIYIYGVDRGSFDQMVAIQEKRKVDADKPWRFVHRLHGFNTPLDIDGAEPIESAAVNTCPGQNPAKSDASQAFDDQQFNDLLTEMWG